MWAETECSDLMGSAETIRRKLHKVAFRASTVDAKTPNGCCLAGLGPVECLLSRGDHQAGKR